MIKSSKIFDIHSLASADSASKAKLFTISSMLSTDRTFTLPLALRKLIFRNPGYILPIDLSLVASITEVSIAPTEPLGYLATKSAFKRNKLFSMSLAISHLNWATTCTYQLLRVVLFLWINHSLCTAFTTSEVRFMTLIAFEISINRKCIFFLIFKVWRTGIF